MQLIVIIETTKKGGVLATLHDEHGRELVRAVSPNLLTWHNTAIDLFNGASRLCSSDLSFIVGGRGVFRVSAAKYFETTLNSLSGTNQCHK